MMRYFGRKAVYKRIGSRRRARPARGEKARKDPNLHGKDACSGMVRVMKKTVSLLLVAAMLLSALIIFTACEQGLVSTITASDAKAQTIVIALVKDEKTTDEAAQRVEDALNAITKSKFNTRVILKFYTPDEYAERIITQLGELESVQKSIDETYDPDKDFRDPRYENIDTSSYTVEENGDLTYKDELGRIITVYPEPRENQLDIVFVDSLKTYKYLLDHKYVISLEKDLIAKSAMRKYMSTAIFTQLNLIGNLKDEWKSTYAIPNNYIARCYRYLLVNKKLYDYYGYDTQLDLVVTDSNNVGGCDDLSDFIMFMREVAENNDTISDDLKVDRVLYNFAGTQWESYYANGDGKDTAMVLTSSRVSFNFNGFRAFVESIFSKSQFKNAQAFLYDLKTDYGEVPYDGDCFYMSTDEDVGFNIPRANIADNEESFAVAMVSGDGDVPNYYNSDDYYVIRTDMPMLDNEVFNSMFAVTTFSSTAVDDEGRTIITKLTDYEDQLNPRCFEILTLLQTSKEVVNLLTYGVRGADYEAFDNDEVFHDTGKGGYYPMVGKMGNTFLCNPNDQMDSVTAFYAKDEWHAAKMQNRSLMISPYCGVLLEEFRDEDGNILYEEGIDGAPTALTIDAEITAYYREAMEKIKNFNGVNEQGKAVSMEDYIASIDSDFKKTNAFKLARMEFKSLTEKYKGPTYGYLPLAQYTNYFTLINEGAPLFDMEVDMTPS